MEAPKDTKNLQSFLGLVNYLTRYSGQLATLTAPLRELTKKESLFSWGPEHDEAFKKVKTEISSLGVLRYFDPKEETVIQTDASLKGIGAVLLQSGQPICYASKALTETEQNYSNIEREALGVVWGLERFHYFVYGKQCTVHTDHKPLEAIFKKKLTTCPARLQRFVLRALKYDVTVKYVKGSEVPIADALSRLSPQPAPPKGQLPQLSIHQVTDTLPASPAKLQQIRELTTSDPTLSQLRDTIYKGWPESREECPSMLHDYWNFREELTIEDGLILKGERIVIPPTLRPEILNTLHKGHLGQEKCLLRARTTVFWPGITKDVTNLVKTCEACQKHQRHNQKQPILQPEPPSYPWQKVSSDLFDYKGKKYLLVSDQYSKFPIIRKLGSAVGSTTSPVVINHLKSIFSEHGIPAQLLSDGGPQYSSREFEEFVTSYGIEHIPSSPHYAQSNGFAERMVQTVENILLKCDENNEDPYLGLLSYRTTPVDHHLKSPAELLTNRKFRTTLPMAQRASLTRDGSDVKEELYRRQTIQEHNYNHAAGPSLTPFKPGQSIRMFDHHTKTWQKGTVLKPAKEPRSYIVRNQETEGVYRRTRSQLRPHHSAPDKRSAASPPDVPTPATTPPESSTTATGYTTRSGRSVRAPDRLDI